MFKMYIKAGDQIDVIPMSGDSLTTFLANARDRSRCWGDVTVFKGPRLIASFKRGRQVYSERTGGH